MQDKKQTELFEIRLNLASGEQKTVLVKGVTREVAERRALKFNPNALSVVRK